MILAGLQKNSLIDYPGKVACVVFVTGCNFTCPFCHNPELARGRYPQRIGTDQLKAFLLPRRQLLDGVVITGGEPTLASGLADLCRLIRDLDLAVKLDTNGSRPDVLSHLVSDHLVDYIAMDIKTTLNGYAPVLAAEEVTHRVAQSVRVILDSDLDYEFRTTCVRPFVDEQIIVRIARSIQGARKYALQPFRPAALLQPDFFSQADPGFSPHEMEQLREEAAPWVQECLLRV